MKLITMTRVICAIFLLSAAPLAADETHNTHNTHGMMVHDAYARSSTATSSSGAAFMMLMNHSGVDDRLIGASSDVAEMVALHSHTADANGVMRMGEIEGGVPLAVDEEHLFQRGGDHIMFMGLKQPLVQGDVIKVTLEFEIAGPVEIGIPVDQDRKPGHGIMKMDHSGHDSMTHDSMLHGSHGKMSD